MFFNRAKNTLHHRPIRLAVLILVTACVSLGVAALLTTYTCKAMWCRVFPWQQKAITSFQECASLGFPITESNPRRCLTPSGSFLDLSTSVQNPSAQVSQPQPLAPPPSIAGKPVIVETPLSGSLIASPLTITGKAKGSWFFEATFPVKLLDANNKLVVQGHAEALSDWMTADFVPFKATLKFTKPKTTEGTLVLENDNPSGLPDKSQQVKIPVRFR